LLVGPAAPDFYEQVEACPDPCDYDAHPAEGVAAPAQWELGVTYSQTRAEALGKTWFGPSQEEFLALFHDVAGDDVAPGYQAAQGGATILTLVLAIEAADSVETDAVRDALDDLEFTSFYGDFDIDETGLQIGHDMVELQWQDGQKVIVWPEAASTGECVYPMP
jgi:branched-chain amino acid transport system substrate-binding protein